MIKKGDWVFDYDRQLYVGKEGQLRELQFPEGEFPCECGSPARATQEYEDYTLYECVAEDCGVLNKVYG